MSYITFTAYGTTPVVDAENGFVHLRFGERYNGVALEYDEAVRVANAMLKAVEDARSAQQVAA